MNLLIYGAGGLAKEVYDLATRNYPDRWEKIYFIDDFAEEGNKSFGETVKFSTVEKMVDGRKIEFEGIVAAGEPDYRERLAEKFKSIGINLTTIFDKTAIISPSAVINQGSIICEMVSIHADAEIGEGVLVQPEAIIGHDIKIGNYSVLGTHSAPGGECIIGERVYIGMNAAIKEKLFIGDSAVVGMGAVVYKDVEAGNTVIGNPARVTRGNDEHRIFKG